MMNRELELLTLEEVINLFKIKESKIRRAIFNKEIPYVKLGGLVRFRELDLKEYIKSNLITCNYNKENYNQGEI